MSVMLLGVGSVTGNVYGVAHHSKDEKRQWFILLHILVGNLWSNITKDVNSYTCRAVLFS